MTEPRLSERAMGGAVHSLVAAQATTRPEQVAVMHRQAQYTYAELDARAARLGNALRSFGVVEGDCIGVCLEPELDVPAVLLAIFKVGAAYVPLDPQYPTGRITEIIEDVRPSVVVSRSALRDRMAGWPEQALLFLDEHATQIAEQSPVLASLAEDPTRIATIFFTSGTTGRPKGARASHEQLAFYARAARTRFGLAPGDVVPTIARFSFSISIFELLVPLTAGATVHVLDRDVVMDPRRMALALEGVTLFHMGPSLLRGVLAEIGRAPHADRYARVRHASSGGDMIPPQLLTAMNEAFSAAEVFVLYGCSEISCMGTWYEVPRSGLIDRTYVGHAFDEMQVCVLDEALQPVPPGTPGEVFFAGPGLIAGYLDRPELDIERFVTIDGVRYYRTGDVGRWHDAHGLELLGRADFQIKVRGMRVESAEVEYHLRQVPGIRDAAVVLRERRGEMVLVAFVVRGGESGEDADALGIRVRRLLSDRVPDYMVPSAIVELPQLPLNHNLKLDRRALPALELTAPRTDAAQAPRTETERWMAAIWCALLERESVGRHQNFFELGGDSLLGLQLILRVEKECGVRLEGIDVLRESLSALAQSCAAARGDHATTTDEGPTVTARRESFFFGPEGSLYGVLERPQSETKRQSVLICGPIGADDVRPSFVISLLMQRLAARGIASMRFDYFGTRDSAGDGADGDPKRWRADIAAAHAELMARTEATAVTAIGIRLGGMLLGTALAGTDWSRVILWDTITDGASFVRNARQAEARRRLRSMPRLGRSRPRSRDGVEEILGFPWSSRALGEIAALRLDASATTAAHVKILQLAGTSLWNDDKLLELMPDTFIVQSLVSLIEEGE